MLRIDLTPDLARSLQDYSLLMGQSREYLLRRALLDYFEDLESRFLAQYPETIEQDWSGRRDLNPRPLDPQSSALPDCATPRLHTPPL